MIADKFGTSETANLVYDATTKKGWLALTARQALPHFNEELWFHYAPYWADRANFAKFYVGKDASKSGHHLEKALLRTGSSCIYAAWINDPFWTVNHTQKQMQKDTGERKEWGKNQYGRSLYRVREMIKTINGFELTPSELDGLKVDMRDKFLDPDCSYRLYSCRDRGLLDPIRDFRKFFPSQPEKGA